MTVRDSDVEYLFDDPDDGWFGQAAVMEPEHEATWDARCVPATAEDALTCTDDLVAGDIDADDSDTDSWYMPVADPTSAAHSDDDRWPVQSSSWDFKASSPSDPWYRSTSAVVAAIVVAAVALVGIVLLLRIPAPAADDPTTVAPTESSGPAPTGTAPTLSSQAPVPPLGLPLPPPPPPPPSAKEINPPVVNRQYSPSYRTPDEPKKPQMDVTRTPMIATPPPRK